MNVWVQQTFNGCNDNALTAANDMWQMILAETDYYSNMDMSYFLLGDFNACRNIYEHELVQVTSRLVSTKCNADFNTPTCLQNILDYVFANRFAVQDHRIISHILLPSIKEAEISDHEAWVMTVY